MKLFRSDLEGSGINLLEKLGVRGRTTFRQQSINEKPGYCSIENWSASKF